MHKKHPFSYLFRPADVLPPLAFLFAALLGRGAAALSLFTALYAAKLCSLAASDGLRAAFATQPSVKYVQGSAVVALIAQLPGAALAALALYLIPGVRCLVPLVPCGMLLNAEQVFYEYLYAIGDKKSAMFSRCITAVLTLLGLMLCMPRNYGARIIAAVDPVWPIITSARPFRCCRRRCVRRSCSPRCRCCGPRGPSPPPCSPGSFSTRPAARPSGARPWNPGP